MVILEVQAARHTPVQFDGVEYIRVGSYKKKLREFPEKERALWRVFDRVPFEQQLAVQNLGIDQVLKLLPSLTIKEDELLHGLDIIDTSLRAVMSQGLRKAACTRSTRHQEQGNTHDRQTPR